MHERIVIVDSTRRGKRMPDALSKTIPIWCAVWNKVLFNEELFFTPPHVVSASEHSQIEAKLSGWCDLLYRLRRDNVFSYRQLTKPLRPIWVTPDSYLPDEIPSFSEFHPIILCTASKMVQDGTEFKQGYTYVQGAADDHELWTKFLTPDLLWANVDKLNDPGLSDSDLHEIIHTLAEGTMECELNGVAKVSVSKLEPTNIYLAKKSETIDITLYNIIIDLGRLSVNFKEPRTNYISVDLQPGKKGSRDLRGALTNIITRVENLSSPKPVSSRKILAMCDSGNDFSVGLALTLLCLYYSNTGMPLERPVKSFLDKEAIRKRLAWIISLKNVNPSRSTLNSVNSYLMG